MKSLQDIALEQELTAMVLPRINHALTVAMAMDIIGEDLCDKIHNGVIDAAIEGTIAQIADMSEGSIAALNILGNQDVKERLNTTITILKGLKV